MRYLVILLFLVPLTSFGFKVIYYDHYTKKNLKSETEMVAIGASSTHTGKIFVMSSITTELLYEANLFNQPDNLYLLDNPDFIVESELIWGEEVVEQKLRLYHRGILVDSLLERFKMEAYFNNKTDDALYYSISSSMDLKWFDHSYHVDTEKKRFVPLPINLENYADILDMNEFSTKVGNENALKINEIPFEEWVKENSDFEDEVHLRITISVLDGKTKCKIVMTYGETRLQLAKVDKLQKLIEQALITDSFYLDRIHSWYFDKSVILNHKVELNPSRK